MRIGNIEIDKPIVLAPMEDVTDLPFRVICKRLGADIVYTEFVNSEGLIRDSRKTKEKTAFAEEERPFGIQIYGGAEESMEAAARIVDALEPDLIDINCGCWVKDVALRGAGAGLLRRHLHLAPQRYHPAHTASRLPTPSCSPSASPTPSPW